MFARNPNPIVRVPFDLIFSVIFLLAGIFFCDGIDAYFALDRWQPPIEDPAKVDVFSSYDGRSPAKSTSIQTKPIGIEPAAEK